MFKKIYFPNKVAQRMDRPQPTRHWQPQMHPSRPPQRPTNSATCHRHIQPLP